MYQGRSHTPAPANGAAIKRSVNIQTSTTSGQIIAVRNPENAQVIVARAWVHVRTRNDSGAATLDIGIAANGTTSSDTIIDGVSVAGSGSIYDNITDKGSNGSTRRLWAAGEYITASVASGDVNGLEADLYVEYLTRTGGDP